MCVCVGGGGGGKRSDRERERRDRETLSDTQQLTNTVKYHMKSLSAAVVTTMSKYIDDHYAVDILSE